MWVDILNNTWVVGIGGGILSGLIVTLITRYLFSKKDNREYAQKVSTVNREVVYALRPGISEGHIPNTEVLSSLINATARKYKIDKNDVYQPKQIAEELIKEIMDSSFISSETKKNYYETLAHLAIEAQSESIPLTEENERKIVESEYRRSQTERMSYILGLTAGMGTVTVVITKFFNSDKASSPFKSIFDIALPSITILLAAIVATVIMITSVRIKRAKEERQASNEFK